MAFTILANSITADATEVMGNFYYVGAGNNLPYFQTTAGNLAAVDNTYDLGADTTAWRRLYAKQIGDSAFGYVMEGTSVTVNAAMTFNSAATLVINCTATIQEINNTVGMKHKAGPLVKTIYVSIGAFNCSNATGTQTTSVDLSAYLTNTSEIVEVSAFLNGDPTIKVSGTSLIVPGNISVEACDASFVCIDFVNAPTLTVAVPRARIFVNNTSYGANSWFSSIAINRGFVRVSYI